ncbi:hypothetical protein BAJUN_01290 [Bajunvirus bajun]|uniref:Uncharacterized protein n=1 Tax=Brevundimonas phage vB_BgoS-Bajun TaxID=2948594 RepID=A0A9E7N7F4_9CAUD|nr:hypothetical protein BAJUN_01290 [Brevundimonas phage vB_BgoS-Bajun]
MVPVLFFICLGVLLLALAVCIVQAYGTTLLNGPEAAQPWVFGAALTVLTLIYLIWHPAGPADFVRSLHFTAPPSPFQ